MIRTELVETVHQDVETRIWEGVKAVIEQILEEALPKKSLNSCRIFHSGYLQSRETTFGAKPLEEEMTSHIGAAPRECTPLRRGERNGHYERDLITLVGKVE